MGHLNGILARVGGNLNNNFQKSQMPGWLPGGGMLKLRFDRYITPLYSIFIILVILSSAMKLLFIFNLGSTIFCFLLVTSQTALANYLVSSCWWMWYKYCCTSDGLQHLESFMGNSSYSSSIASPTDYQYKGLTRQTIKCFCDYL